MTTALQILLGLGIAIAGLILSAMVFAVVMVVINTTTEFLNKVMHYGFDWQARKTDNQRASLQAQIHRIMPDEHGYNGIVWDGQTYLNLDTGELIAEQVQQAVQPLLEEWRIQNYEQRKLLTAMGNIPIGKEQVQGLLEQSTEPELPLKTYVSLNQLIRQYNVRVGYDKVILGETVVGDEYKIVTGSMEVFLHGIVTGRTGFGKSVQLASIAKQLVMGNDCEVCFVDYGVNTFGMLAEFGKFPIADEPDRATELFRRLVVELNNRRSLMADFPEARTIQEYNRLSGENLKPLVCFVDESSSLFDKSNDCRGLVRELTSMGRKYQLGVFFGGTDFKVTTMPSETRGNCGLRQAFRLEEPQLSRAIIRTTEAVNLTVKGRALALIPEVPGIVKMQCPIVEQWNDLPKATGQECLPEVMTLDEQIKEAYDNGHCSISAICRELDFHTGGDDFYNVREAMNRLGLLE